MGECLDIQPLLPGIFIYRINAVGIFGQGNVGKARLEILNESPPVNVRAGKRCLTQCQGCGKNRHASNALVLSKPVIDPVNL